MSMIVASALPTHPRRPRVLAGLYPDVPSGEAVLLLSNTATVAPDGTTTRRDYGQVGRPVGLGILYAQYPLLTLFGLLGVGWAGGYFTWLWLGRRKR